MERDQLDVKKLEKETIIIYAELLNIISNKNFNLYPILKFFTGFDLNHQDLENIESFFEELKEIEETYKINLPIESVENLYKDYVYLYNKVIVKSIFNQSLFKSGVYIKTIFITKDTTLNDFLEILKYIIYRQTFITVTVASEKTKRNLAVDLAVFTHIPISKAAQFGLTYPNRIAILNDITIFEKVNKFFKQYKQ